MPVTPHTAHVPVTLVARKRLRYLVALSSTAVALTLVTAMASPAFNGAPAGHGAETSANAASTKRMVKHAEIELMLHIADLTPENLAAAGVGRLDFDELADAALAYCIQADRVSMFATASKNLNILKSNATKVPAKRTALPDQGAPTTIAQAQSQVDEIKNSAFAFITTGLAADKKAALATIRSNLRHEVPSPYKLLQEQTNAQWLALRNALAAQRIAEKHGRAVSDQASAVISRADGNAAVAASKLAYDANLAIIQDEWATKLPADPLP